MSYASEPFRSRPQARFLGEPSGKPINESPTAVPELQNSITIYLFIMDIGY